MLSWKAPTRTIESNSWPHAGHPNNPTMYGLGWDGPQGSPSSNPFPWQGHLPFDSRLRKATLDPLLSSHLVQLAWGLLTQKSRSLVSLTVLWSQESFQHTPEQVALLSECRCSFWGSRAGRWLPNEMSCGSRCCQPRGTSGMSWAALPVAGGMDGLDGLTAVGTGPGGARDEQL